MSHVISSETGMKVQRLLRLVDNGNGEGLKVVIRWRGLPASEDTLELLDQVNQEGPQILAKLLDRKNTPPSLAKKSTAHTWYSRWGSVIRHTGATRPTMHRTCTVSALIL